MISTSPRKVVPLASGDDYAPKPAYHTKRVFFAAVVVEGAENNAPLDPDVHDLVMSLGHTIDTSSSDPSSSSAQASLPKQKENSRKPLPPVTDSEALHDNINELVASEREYVRRLTILKQNYADPLREYSKNKNTRILEPYDATTLFGNIDHLLPVNMEFLTDLEMMVGPNGHKTVGGVGDVALKHLRDRKGFEQYRHYYAKREAAQAIFEREMKKSRFSDYVDRQKYHCGDLNNRVGLRELLMEPVQRVPRYTLLFREMIRHMAPSNPQREKLLAADKIASSIAKADPGEETKRATILACLNAAIQDFPADLISSSRKFIDYIDVEDVLRPPGHDMSSSTSPNLHCSLLLFDDKLVIVKRPSNGEKGAAAIAGLGDIEKTSKSLSSKKKGSMMFKGVLDITDVVATDAGGTDVHIFLEAPPNAPGLSERWANRPFRCLTVVNPPASSQLDPLRIESEKNRFLENLWITQARYRARLGQSVVLCHDELEVESKGGRVTSALTYFNVYQRMAFLQEHKKNKVVVHIDALGAADNIPFGLPSGAPPLVVIRVQPIHGNLCRYKVTCSDPNDDEDEDVVHTGRVPARIVHTIQQFGVFKFKTFVNSRPSTPTGSTRSRAAKFGLDAISRGLFSSTSRPLSTSSSLRDFGGSISSSTHHRSKSSASRSSAYNSTITTSTSATTENSVAKFSYRSNSTAATTMSSVASGSKYHDQQGRSEPEDDDEDVFFATRSASKSAKQKPTKLTKRGRSPHGSDSEGADSSGGQLRRSRSIVSRNSSRSRSRAGSVSSAVFTSDEEEEPDRPPDRRPTQGMDPSELDLAIRLDLARRNSKNQHGLRPAHLGMERPTEETIYEVDDLSLPSRPESRASKQSSQYTVTQANVPPDFHAPPRPPSRASVDPHTRPESRNRGRGNSNAADRRPRGPRSPSPLPPTSPRALPQRPMGSPDRIDLEKQLLDLTGGQIPHSNFHTPVPRHGRTVTRPLENLDDSATLATATNALLDQVQTPQAAESSKPRSNTRNSIVEPLSIKKKTSVSTGAAQSTPSARKPYVRNSPLSKGTSRIVSPRRVSPQVRSARHAAGLSKNDDQTMSELVQYARATKTDIESARRVVKRMRVETDNSRSSLSNGAPGTPSSRPSSPEKLSHASQSSTGKPHTKEALKRMEEMRNLIGKRSEDLSVSASTPNRWRPTTETFANRPQIFSGAGSSTEPESPRDLNDIDMHLSKACSNIDRVESDLQALSSDMRNKLSEFEQNKIELQNVKRQCELVKSLLQDATAEKEIMYDAFNEELDAMYDDIQLPEDQAWPAMAADLQKTKESRNALNRENSNLKQRLAEVELQCDQWGEILRSHGLIP